MIYSKKNIKFLMVSLSCLACFMFIAIIQAQQTFSKTYHLEVGSENRAAFLFLDGDEFIIATTHSGDTSVVSALSRFDYDGNILDQNSYSDYVFGLSRSVVRTANGFEIGGHSWSKDENFARGLELVKVNNDLDFLERKLLFYQEERSVNLPGILDVNDSLKVVYGSFVKNTVGIDGGAYVGFLNKANDSISNELIYRGVDNYSYVEYDVFDLQNTIDSNLLFIAETRQRDESVTGSSSFFEILKFNQDGEILNRVKSKADADNRSIYQDEEGGIYFYNLRTPFLLDTVLPFADRLGGLVKINEEMDSVLWSFQIRDFDGISEDRSHLILGINPLSDGNLLGVGTVFSSENYIPETIGFLCKFTKDGEILWVREYGIPIPEEYLSESLIGVLASGRIEDCKELEDGRLLCMGENAYSIPGTSFYRELWILMLDEDGCLTPDCEPTLIFTNTHEVETFQEGNIYPNPVSDILHISDVEFDEYKIYDLMGRLVQKGSCSPTIDLSSLPASGMYVLQLKEEGKLKSVFNLVKN